MVQIIPAILATTEEDYSAKLKKIEESGLFTERWVQIDLMDKKFVQNRSIGPEIITKYPTKLKLETHLMVEYPENWIEELVKIDRVNRIIFPVEDLEGLEERINHIRNHEKQVGLSINPETPASKVKPYLDSVDLILVMSVHPGLQGQEFIPESISRIKEVLRFRLSRAQSRGSGNKFMIEVDGGISGENARQVVEAGADYLVVGSNLFKYDNLREGLEKILQAING